MATAFLDELDMERLIGEIAKYPAIWDLSCNEYCDRLKRRAAWMDISREFCPDFDMKDERRKEAISKELMKKWRNVKDNYLKRLKKLPSTGKSYVYAKQLSFLQSVYGNSDQQLSCAVDEDNENQERWEEHDQFLEVDLQYNALPQDETKKRKREEAHSPVDFLEYVAPTVMSAPDPSAERAFFESILPFVNQFTEDQKLDFRCEVLDLIRKFRRQTPIQANSNRRPDYVPSNEAYFATPHCSSSFPRGVSHQGRPAAGVADRQSTIPSQLVRAELNSQPASPSSTITKAELMLDEDAE